MKYSMKIDINLYLKTIRHISQKSIAKEPQSQLVWLTSKGTHRLMKTQFPNPTLTKRFGGFDVTVVQQKFFESKYQCLQKGGRDKKGAAKFEIEHNSANMDQIKLLSIDMKTSLNFKKKCKFTFSKKIIFLTKNWHLLKIAFFFSIIEFPSETDIIRFKQLINGYLLYRKDFV